MTSLRHLVLPAVALTAAGVLAAAPRKSAPAAARTPPQQVTGPVASYWMSAATSSGFGFGAMAGAGEGRKPSLGEVMRMMRGGGGGAVHELTLQLGSTQRPVGAAKADHLPGAGKPLPLGTPQVAPPSPIAEETVEDQPSMAERPKGRILLYWGCGEHAGPGQPVVLDFSKMLDGQAMPRLPFVAVRRQNPPSAGRFATYGEWPANNRDRRAPASLVGDHQVRGTYSPDIRFALPADREWMAPLALDAGGKTPAGATVLGWNAVPNATGYFAMLFGASADRMRQGDTVSTLVMWSSSSVATFAGGGLLDYLTPAEAARLIGQKVVMPPSQTQCLVPAEVAGQGRMGLVSMIAYGPETNLADPPRPTERGTPWNISWTVKARYKSTTGVILGVAGGTGAGAGRDAPEEALPPRKRGGGLLGKLKDAADAIPH